MLERLDFTQLSEEYVSFPVTDAKKSVEDNAALPEWFAFDEKTALAHWDLDNSLLSGAEILVQEEVTSGEKESTLPDWFQFSESEYVAVEVKGEVVIPDEVPDWFSFSPADTEVIQKEENEAKAIQSNNREKPLPKSDIFYRAYKVTSGLKEETTAQSESVVIVDYDAQASKGLSKIAASLDSMDYVTKTIATHMATCNGADGHKARSLNEKTMSEARERAMVNVMNTAIGQKLSKGEELTEKDQQSLDEIISMTYESTLGIDTKNIRNNGVKLSDRSQVRSMMPHIIPEHIHGAGCNHGGAMNSSVTGSIYGWGHLSGKSSFSSFFGHDNHEHHDKLFYCSSCEKTHRIHVHDPEDVVCPKCKSSNVKEVKEKRRH